MVMISCILLTAGESQRFGQPKALAQIQNSTAIEILQHKVLQSLMKELIVVTGAHEHLVKPLVFNHSNIRIVHNKDYKFGQTSSFQQGILSCDSQSDGFMLLPVDCPFVLTDTMDTLIKHFETNKPSLLIPTYQSKKGHPPIFHKKLKPEILKLDVHKGLNHLIAHHPSQLLEINDPGIVWSFNTQEELDKIITGTINKNN